MEYFLSAHFQVEITEKRGVNFGLKIGKNTGRI